MTGLVQGMAIPRPHAGRAPVHFGTPGLFNAWRFHSDLFPLSQDVDFSQTPIAAIFVFHDPRNWSLDIQIALDVLRSRGIIGAPYADASPQTRHGEAPAPIELVFCNPDLLWTSDFPRPRLGQGAFRDAFQAVYKVRPHFSPLSLSSVLTLGAARCQSVTGGTYPYTQYGKPTRETYEFAAGVLRDRLQELQGGKPVERMPSV